MLYVVLGFGKGSTGTISGELIGLEDHQSILVANPSVEASRCPNALGIGNSSYILFPRFWNLMLNPSVIAYGQHPGQD